MLEKYILELELEDWQKLLKDPMAFGKHISERRLVELTQPGRLSNATDEEIRHLACCPRCLFDWVELSSNLKLFDCISIKAASSPLISEFPSVIKRKGVSIKIYQEIKEKIGVMIVLELAPEFVGTYKGKLVVVKDAEGNILLSGRFSSKGKVVAHIDNFDLTKARNLEIFVEE